MKTLDKFIDQSPRTAIVTIPSSLISSLGMAIGVGGGSVLSRALGAKNQKKAKLLLPIKL
jgi:Na+-driven multidrug efflux pump